jgi:DHA1 family bicyclomycin/chloramphenicol resistance-like MFS transporter
MPPAPLNQDSRLTLLFLAAMVALGPLSVDMYLPAMPTMQRELGTDIAHMHLTLSAYLWGFAIFHLACGPLADRYGRRPLLLGGFGLFVLASAGCALSTSVEELTAYRFVQGIGACVGPTLGRTITRDVFGPHGAARALSLIAMLMALAPAIAPGLGGIMLRWVPWPSVFVFLGLYSAGVMLLVWRYLPETLPAPQSLAPLAIARNYLRLLRDPVFLPVAAASALVYSGLTVYLASSGFVFIDMLGVSVEFFGLIFLTTVIGYMSGSALSARLATQYRPPQVLLFGALLGVAASAGMLVLQLAAPTKLLPIVVPMAFYSASLGLVMPHAMALALEHHPLIAATTSALFGFFQMTLAAVITGVVGTVMKETPQPMIIAMLGATTVALLLVLRARAVLRGQATRDEATFAEETAA